MDGATLIAWEQHYFLLQNLEESPWMDFINDANKKGGLKYKGYLIKRAFENPISKI